MKKKKWIFIVAALVVVIGVIAYFGPVGREGPPSSNGDSGTGNLGGLQIKIDNSFFEAVQIPKQLWLIVETTIQNNGDEVEYFLFGQTSRFYVQDADSKTYATINAHEYRWAEAKGKIALSELKLYPKEKKTLTLQVFNVPSGAAGLRLFCRASAVEGGKTISIPFTPSSSSQPSATPVPPKTPTPTAPATSTTPATIAKGSPSEAALKFFTLWLVERNYAEAEKMLTDDSKARAAAQGGLKGIFETGIAPGGDTSIKCSVAILDEKVLGDRATVKIELTGEYKGEKKVSIVEFEFKKVEGIWLFNS